MTTRILYEGELKELNNQLIEMAGEIEKAIERCMNALKTRDYSGMKAIIEGDRIVNDMERSIESKCLTLIMKQQPVAKDLRMVSTALKVVTDMERIGDHAADIAEILLRLEGTEGVSIIKEVPDMAEAAKKMVREAVEAFIQADVKRAEEIAKEDDIVDEYFNKVKLDVAETMKKDVEKADICVDVLMIAKYLERIGDHAVNICEWTEFHETGRLNRVKIM